MYKRFQTAVYHFVSMCNVSFKYDKIYDMLYCRYIEYAKNESYVRGQDYFTVLQYIAGNPIGRPLVWDWVKNNWQYLVDR